MILNSLNEQQDKAVKIINGPVMVFAGAGSGKTRTLTFRIANLIENSINPTNILAITFTNKATNEMRARLFTLVGEKARLLTISTFHALCASILRKEIAILGYSNRFFIIDDEDQLKVIGEVLSEVSIDKKVYSPKRMRSAINKAKCFDYKLEDPQEKKIFNRYEAKMKEENLLDFEDLLLKVRELFLNYPEVLKRYRSKFKYILVDEFQDTDLIQYHILKLLAGEHHNIFVVGDDDQSIYSFRGSNYENMKLFKKDFPEHHLILLEENYRSSQIILDGSNRLIANNSDREAKSLFSNIPGSDDDVIIHQARDEVDEVNYVINEIKRLLKKGYTHSDIAVVYRASSISRNFELGFIRFNLPYKIYGGISYLKRREVKDIIAYFRLIVFPNDIHSFKRIVNTPTRGIGAKSVETLLNYRQENKLSLDEAIADLSKYLPSRVQAFKNFTNIINYFRQKIEDTDLLSLYEELLDKTNYLAMLEDEEDKEDRIANLMEFKSILYTIENSGELASRSDKLISAFDEAILSDDKLQSQKYSQEGITLSTIHSVKGLEFKAVFLVAFENGIFPNLYRYGDDQTGLEEERRIAYVATTRAKTKLYLTCAQKRLLYGQTTYNQQSMFFLEFVDNKTFDTKELEISDFETKEEVKKSTYQVGDLVNHLTYGEGMVVSLSGDIGKICFIKQGTIKTFDMTHKAIKKTNKKQ